MIGFVVEMLLTVACLCCCVRLEGRWAGEFLLGAAGAGKEAERSIC